jgi:hypothetical protein
MGKLSKGVLLSSVLAACTGEPANGSPSGDPGDAATGRVAGLWRFGFFTDARDDYSVYQLDQSGANLSGHRCTTQHDCDGGTCIVTGAICDGTPLAGTVSGSALTLGWEFDEDAGLQKVMLELTLSADGQTMAGSGSSTKCGCQFTLRAARVVIGQKLPVP